MHSLSIGRFLPAVPVLLAGSLSAATVVRVAFSPDDGLSRRLADGSSSGLVAEHVTELARLNGWTVRNVACGRGEALEKLRRGGVDLVGGVVPTPKLRSEFRFSTYPAGAVCARLFVPTNSPCVAGRADTWTNLVIAVGPESEIRQMLETELKGGGCACQLRPFASDAAAVAAFGRGETSAVCAPGTAALLSAKPLMSLAPVPLYFCTSKERGADNLVRLLNSGLLRLRTEKPSFARDLERTLFPAVSGPDDILTAAERLWLEHRRASRKPIVVDLSPLLGNPFLPPSLPTEGRVGFASFLLNEVSRRTGLIFAFLSPTTEAEAHARFGRNSADVWLPDGLREADLASLRMGFRTPELRTVLVRRRGTENHPLAGLRLGVPQPASRFRAAYAEIGVSDLTPFDTPAAALKALRAHRVDAVPMTASCAGLLIRLLDAGADLVKQPSSFRLPYDSLFAFMLSEDADPRLESVLRKCIAASARVEVIVSATYRKFEGTKKKPLLTDRQWLTLILSLVFVALATGVLFFLVYNRRLAKALVRAEAGERSRTRFLATISHEIRTPLNAVIGFAEFLRTPHLASDDVARYVDGIDKASHVLLDLINDVLDLAKLDSDKVDVRGGTLDLGALAAEMAEIFSARAARKGVRLHFALPEAADCLALSPLYLRQTLLNLIGNAVKFTESGSITVTFAVSPRPSASADVTITVADTGIGIPPELMPTIFDPFVQDIAARGGHIYEGTGLGLPLVNRIIEVAGGTVDVSSETGRGSTFVLRIPNVRLVPPVVAAPVSPSPPVSLPKSVVIVDDVPMNLRILQLHLERLGITDVRAAESGERALALLAERSAEIVLMDMWMPGMNGSELARRILADPTLSHPRLVAVTADVSSTETFDLSSFESVITKPVSREQLLAAFARKVPACPGRDRRI